MREESQSNKVYSELRRKVLSNQLMPGARLKENEWAVKTGVSRVSVREALNRLLGEGLLVSGEKGGYYVQSLDATDIQGIRELRELLELGALRLAFKKITPAEIAGLEKICDDFTLMVQNGYPSGACEADMRFHETLINIAGNAKLKQLYELSNIPLFHLKLGKSIQHMDDYDLTNAEHRDIVRALKSGNVKKAEDALLKHLNRGQLASLEL